MPIGCSTSVALATGPTEEEEEEEEYRVLQACCKYVPGILLLKESSQ